VILLNDFIRFPMGKLLLRYICRVNTRESNLEFSPLKGVSAVEQGGSPCRGLILPVIATRDKVFSGVFLVIMRNSGGVDHFKKLSREE